jgi:CheY-like chemotaxis protein
VSHGKIIVAEDFPIVMNVIKNQIAELGMTEQCSFCYDGEEAINIASNVIKAAIYEKPTTAAAEIRPIDLMILDFQMPRKNGLDVI